MSRLMMLHMYQLFQCMKKFAAYIKKLSGESRAGSKLIWIWLEGAEKGDFLRVYGGWEWMGPGWMVLHMDWVLHSLNFPLTPKEQAPGLSYQFSQMSGTEKREVVGLDSCHWVSKMELDPSCYTYLFRSFPIVLWLLQSLNPTRTGNSLILPPFSVLNLSISTLPSF